MRLNATLLVDAMVRQTVVLIATLATGAGQRTSLSHVADLVFADLVRELKQQGLGNKVIADMFGMALRTYHKRVAQLTESRSAQGHSLWAAVHDWIASEGPVLRAQVLSRFQRDDPSMVRAVLRDLAESGLVERSGRGDATQYRVRPTQPIARDDSALVERMLLVAVHRHGPASLGELQELVPVDGTDVLEGALERLEHQGLLRRQPDADATRYSCERCIIPFGDDAGWEAAVFDHYQAMVAALVTKLRSGKRRADLADRVGGSTFVFDVHAGHPLRDEALGYLEATRAQGLSLRKRIDAHDAAHPPPADAVPVRVIAYVGQTVAERDPEAGEEDDDDDV